MTDLARQIIANQSHRKTMDPMSFRRWDRPFCIERITAAAASTASDPSTLAAERTGQGSSQ